MAGSKPEARKHPKTIISTAGHLIYTNTIARELEQLPLPRLQHKLQKSCKVGAGSQREIIVILALLTPDFWCPRN
jgi:hypothetical protein